MNIGPRCPPCPRCPPRATPYNSSKNSEIFYTENSDFSDYLNLQQFENNGLSVIDWRFPFI